MQALQRNPIGRLSKQHQSEAVRSCYVTDTGAFEPILNVDNDAQNADPFRPLALQRLAYHHYGLVRIDETLHSLSLRWNVQQVSDLTLNKTLEYLVQLRRPKTVYLNFYHGGWCTEGYKTTPEALRRICVIRSLCDVEPDYGIYQNQHSISEIDTSASKLIRNCYANWKHFGTGRDFYGNRNAMQFLPAMQIFSLTSDDSEILFDHVGSNTLIANLLGKDWQQQACGTTVSGAHDDQEFEDAVCLPYWKLMESGEPYYDHVRAFIYRDGSDPIWLTYQRLIFPIFNGRQNPQLGVVIQPTQNISLPYLQPKQFAQ